jgi:hypothetical protein
MKDKKAFLSLRIRADLKSAIEKIAKEECRTPGNLGELRLEWAYKQLKTAGNSIELLSWRAQPPSGSRTQKNVPRHDLFEMFQKRPEIDKTELREE